MRLHDLRLGGILRRQNRWIDRAVIGAFASISLSLAAQTSAPATQTTTTTTTATPTTEQVATPAPSQARNENPVVLDPFVETESSNVGYGAGTTSATARVVQSYVDVPQTVNVITSEFLEDYSSQDVRQALEYVPNIDFGLNDNPYSMHLRAANVTSTYIDGVTIPGQYNSMPFDFFDRIEIVKGPSSIAFGLGQPGGLVNYVSKTPQGIDSTSASFGVGNDGNYLFRFDMQRVDKDHPKLSYRAVAFWDEGGYQYPNLYHNGAGGQVSVNYAMNPTTNIGLIVAYSSTTYPAQQYENSIFAQETLYQILQLLEVGNPVFTSQPGTKLSNGSIYGVSGPLPPAGSQGMVGIFGTGRLLGTNTNLNPPGYDGNTNEDLRAELLITKSLADGHIHLRNQLALDFDTNYVYEETPNAVYSIPGPNNTGWTPAELPGGNWVFDQAQAGPGAPLNPNMNQTFLTEQRTYNRDNASSRYDEIDALATYNFFTIDWQALVGADFYDTEQYGYGYLIPNTNAAGAQIAINMFQPNNTPLYLSPNGWVSTGDSSSHSWGDGFFAQVDALPFNGMFDLMAGWRIDYFDTETINYGSPTTVYHPGWVNTKGAPRFSITYKPFKWLSLYELYTKHADPTLSTNKYFISSGTEDNPPLSTEYPLTTLEFYQPGGYTVESGMKASLFDGKLYASLAVFHEIVTGDLSPLVIARATNPDGTNTQIAEQVITGFNAHGVEAEVFGQITPRFTFTANWGFTRGFYPGQLNNLAQETGKGNLFIPNYVDPPETISGHFKYDFGNLHGSGFYATFGTEFWSPYYIWQSTSFDWYYSTWQHQLDGGVGYRWKWGKYENSLFFEMNNIEDNQIVIGTVTPWTEEPLRTWFVTYKVKF